MTLMTAERKNPILNSVFALVLLFYLCLRLSLPQEKQRIAVCNLYVDACIYIHIFSYLYFLLIQPTVDSWMMLAQIPLFSFCFSLGYNSCYPLLYDLCICMFCDIFILCIWISIYVICALVRFSSSKIYIERNGVLEK